jgi:hypothetical protein
MNYEVHIFFFLFLLFALFCLFLFSLLCFPQNKAAGGKLVDYCIALVQKPKKKQEKTK